MRDTILVVEDEPDILDLVSFNLEQAGFAVLRAEYGEKALQKSEAALTIMGKEGFTALKNDFDQLVKQLHSQKNEDPQSEAVQALIASHYLMIRKFWGTSQEADKQAEAYAGLGQLYLADERFTLVNGKSDPEFAPFLQKAMAHYADTQLQ